MDNKQLSYIVALCQSQPALPPRMLRDKVSQIIQFVVHDPVIVRI